MITKDDGEALKAVFKRFIASHPENNRLFAFDDLRYWRHDEENHKILNAYIKSQRRGLPVGEVGFIRPEYLIEIQSLNTAYAVQALSKVIGEFSISQGYQCDIVLRMPIDPKLTIIPVESEDGYLRITFRLREIDSSETALKEH